MCFLINTQSRFASSVFKRSTSTWRFPCFSVVLKSKGKICWKTFDKGYSWGLELEAVKSTLSNKSCSNKKFLADLLLSDIEPLTLRPLCSCRLRSNKKCSVDQLLLGSNLLNNVRPGQTFFDLTTPMAHTYFFAETPLRCPAVALPSPDRSTNTT